MSRGTEDDVILSLKCLSAATDRRETSDLQMVHDRPGSIYLKIWYRVADIDISYRRWFQISVKNDIFSKIATFLVIVMSNVH